MNKKIEKENSLKNIIKELNDKIKILTQENLNAKEDIAEFKDIIEAKNFAYNESNINRLSVKELAIKRLKELEEKDISLGVAESLLDSNTIENAKTKTKANLFLAIIVFQSAYILYRIIFNCI